MNRSRFRRRGWIPGIVLLAILMLLTARMGELSTGADVSSPAGWVATLVTCVLSAGGEEPPAVLPPAATTPREGEGCGVVWADQLRTVWISAC